jgi:hypothetical protein
LAAFEVEIMCNCMYETRKYEMRPVYIFDVEYTCRPPGTFAPFIMKNYTG